MQFFLETFIVVVLCLAAFLLAFLIILNLYLLKKNGFYVSANCWFCNNWTKVAYQDRNSFNCPSCSQYNGFKEDGSYNKVIEAQHNVSFTKYATQKTANYGNGLCTYCNNNQRLKVYQLAKFTPLNEENYSLEVEHFQKQLEKAYKLCKKCENVLKFTIDRQQSWLFGNRLKDFNKRRASMLNVTKSIEVKNFYFLRFIRYILIILTIFILCHNLKVKVMYPNINWNKYLPTKVFSLYKIILLDLYNKVLHAFQILGKEVEGLNVYLSGDVKIYPNIMTLVTILGCTLDLILSCSQKKSILWKINGFFAWILLISTSSLSFTSHLAIYLFSIQVFASATLLCYYLWFPSILTTKSTKEYHFKRISRQKNTEETSEEETDEEIIYPVNVTPNSKKSSPKSYRAHSPLSQNLNSSVYLNSFSTAKSVTSTSDLYNFSNSSGSDLNQSLDNLHLTKLGLKPHHRQTSPIFSVSPAKRPLLSPSRLKNITQNPWTAGGFWKNDASVLSATIHSPILSRSSSQSSGFVSTHDNNLFNSLPASREPSSTGDVDRISILSEPPYHFSPISPTNTDMEQVKNPRFYYKADNNIFYPVLSQNNMLFIKNGVPHQSFGNSSLKSFNTRASVFREKPISPLFKNLQQSQSFNKSQF